MTAYVRNAWYVAAWEEEVEGQAVLARILLDEPKIVFRTQAGYALLADRCPHRFAPLSMGARDGDVIVCPYHGLGFSETGACVRNPFSEHLPKNAVVPSWPVTARHGLIWFWPGDAALADPAAIPDLSFLDGQDIKRGRSNFRGHYELLTDNLMDLSHVEFLHQATFRPNGAAQRGRFEVKDGEGGAIWSNWWLPDVNKPPFLDDMLAADAKADQHLHMLWHAPATMVLEITWTAQGGAREDVLVRFTNPHIITPETATSSHYFWTCEPNEHAEALARVVFEDEDRPMIEAVQRSMGAAEFWDLNPVILKADAAGVYVRRRLMQMRRAERGGDGEG